MRALLRVRLVILPPLVFDKVSDIVDNIKNRVRGRSFPLRLVQARRSSAMAESLFALYAALSAKPVGTVVMLAVIAFTVSVRKREYNRRLGVATAILPLRRGASLSFLRYFRHAA